MCELKVIFVDWCVITLIRFCNETLLCKPYGYALRSCFIDLFFDDYFCIKTRATHSIYLTSESDELLGSRSNWELLVMQNVQCLARLVSLNRVVCARECSSRVLNPDTEHSKVTLSFSVSVLKLSASEI